MRKQMWTILSGAAVVLLVAQMVLAQEAPATQPASGPASREGRGMRGPIAPRVVDELIKELALSEETGAKVRALFDEFREATRTWQRQNSEKLRDLYEQLRDAGEANDQAKVKELSEQVGKLLQDRLVARDSLLKQLTDILTPEQLEKVKDVVIEWRAMLRGITREMTLSDPQKAKLEEIIKTWREESGEGVAPDRRGLANLRALIEKVVTEVILTDAQRQALAAMTGEEGFFEKVMKLDLTDVQKAQVDRFRLPGRGRRGRGGPESGPGSGPAGGPPPGGGAGPPPGEGPR